MTISPDNPTVPELPVTVTVTPPLAAAVDAAPDLVGSQVQEQLAQLLGELGVPGRPVVRIETGGPTTASYGIGLTVAGRPCRFPPVVVAEALAYIDGTAQVLLDSDAVIDQLHGAGTDLTDDAVGSRVAQLLGDVCRTAVAAQPGVVLTSDAAVNADSGSEPLVAALASQVDVHVEPAYLRRITANNGGAGLFRFLRESLFDELGLPLPPFHLRLDPSLRPDGFAFRINAVRTQPRIGLPTETIMVNETVERLGLLGIDAVPMFNPAAYRPAALVERRHQERLEAAGRTTWDSWGFLILCFAAELRRTAHTLLTKNTADELLRRLGESFPSVERAARAHIPLDLLTLVLRELLRDGVSIRNLLRIAELLIRYETTEAADGGSDRVTYIRQGLADAIATKSSGGTNTVVAYLLGPEFEDAVAEHQRRTEPWDAADDVPDRLASAVRAELSMLPPTAQTPVVLTRDDLRRPIARILNHEFPLLTVLGYGDLPAHHNVQPVARISVT